MGALLALLRCGAGRELRMYSSYQPCHYSSGRLNKLLNGSHKMPWRGNRSDLSGLQSCVERLLAYFRRELAPRNVTLTIAVTDLYKVGWAKGFMQNDVERSVYGGDARRGHEGLQLLLAQPGVTMRAMRASDWDFLVSCCDPAVRVAYQDRCSGAPPFTHAHRALRAKLDAYIAGFSKASVST